MTRIPPAARTLGPAVCLALALAACSGGSSAPSGAAPASSAASSAPASAPAAAPTEGATVVGADLSKKLAQALAGAPAGSLSMVLTQAAGEPPTSAQGAAVYAADGSRTSLTVDTGDPDTGKVTMLAAPGALYVQTEKGNDLPAGKEWVKVSDLAKATGIYTALYGALAGNLTAFAGPDGVLRALAAAPELTVKSVDPDGTVTYTAVLKQEQVAELYDLALFGGDKAARAEVARAGTDDGSYTLLLGVDGTGLPTAVQLQGTSEGNPVSATTTYTGWAASGTPIAEPAQGVTVESAELDKQLNP